MKKVIIKSPTDNVIETLTGKKVLFLENDNVLANGLEEFESILAGAKIDYTILFELSETPIHTITDSIKNHDVIVFQTRWVSDISKKLHNYIKSLNEKKIVIECYIYEPTWFYHAQHGTHHDVYIYSCRVEWGKADKNTETFYKLTDKPYWDYENGFNI